MLRILIGLGVRVSGMVIGLYAIRNGVAYIGGFSGERDLYWYQLILASNFLILVASILMIVFPITLADKLLPGDLGAEPAEPLTSEKIEYLASSLAGLYFLVDAVGDWFYIFGVGLVAHNMGLRWVWTGHHAGVALASTVQIIFAIWFLFGAKGLWGIVRWARQVGPHK